MWSPDGSELFYRDGDTMTAVPFQMTDAGFVPGPPVPLFTRQYLLVNTRGGRDYDYDGERFVMVKQVEDTPSAAKIVVVQNWFEELKRLAPPAQRL